MKKIKVKEIWLLFVGIATVIPAIPYVYEWLSGTPQASFYICNREMKEGQKVVLNYLIPVDTTKGVKFILPFPLSVINKGDKDIPNFYIEFRTETKSIDENAVMLRLFINEENPLHLESFGLMKSNTQRIYSMKDNSILPAGWNVTNFFDLNIVYDKAHTGREPWDYFNIEIETASKNISAKKYEIEIRCYDLIKESEVIRKIQSLKQESEKHFILRPYVSNSVKFDDDRGHIQLGQRFALESSDIQELP